jgi:hypothetical protein
MRDECPRIVARRAGFEAAVAADAARARWKRAPATARTAADDSCQNGVAILNRFGCHSGPARSRCALRQCGRAFALAGAAAAKSSGETRSSRRAASTACSSRSGPFKSPLAARPSCDRSPAETPCGDYCYLGARRHTLYIGTERERSRFGCAPAWTAGREDCPGKRPRPCRTFRACAPAANRARRTSRDWSNVTMATPTGHAFFGASARVSSCSTRSANFSYIQSIRLSCPPAMPPRA